MIIEGTKENFNELINDDLVLVDFFAVWCGPCRMLSPVLDNLAQESQIKIVKMDVDKTEEIARNFGIMSVPTLILFKNGEMVSKQTGLMSKEDLLKWIEENR